MAAASSGLASRVSSTFLSVEFLNNHLIPDYQLGEGMAVSKPAGTEP